MTRGAFVTLEGGEGVGKSTNMALVTEVLRSQGFDVVATREPGGTELGERIRQLLLHGEHGPIGALTETLLMLAARSEHLDRVIRPALAAGRWVVCDRFTDATWAYQGGGRGVERQLLEQLTTAVQGDTVPDLTLLLDAPLDVGAARMIGRNPDNFERESRAFFERVRQAYLERAAREPNRVVIVDASQPLEAVQSEIRSRLTAFVQTFRGDRP